MGSVRAVGSLTLVGVGPIAHPSSNLVFDFIRQNVDEKLLESIFTPMDDTAAIKIAKINFIGKIPPKMNILKNLVEFSGLMSYFIG
jgi:hypothetical protein